MQDFRQNQVNAIAAQDPLGQALRLLQVLDSRAKEIQSVTTLVYEQATLLSFSDYADAFRRVQEFLSFCDVIESKLDNIPPTTREPILHEITAIKVRAFHALLRGMGAYLTALERRGAINIFAQSVFLMQQDALQEFQQQVLPELQQQLIPDNMAELCAEVLQRLKRLLDRCIDVPDFRFAP